MEIVKKFQSNNFEIEICVKGTNENPLFRANDIATILELTNIHKNIKDFDNTERTELKVNTLGGVQDVSFLTEKGLYQILFTSRKPIAKQFKNWVCEVIHDLRLQGSYKLNQQLLMKDKMIQDKESEILSIKKHTIIKNKEDLIKKHSKKRGLYVCRVPNPNPNPNNPSEDILKGGIVGGDIEERLLTHQREISPDILLIYFLETPYNNIIEKKIKQLCTDPNDILYNKRTSRIYKNKNQIDEKNQTELYIVDDNFTAEDFWNKILLIEKSLNKDEIFLKLENDLTIVQKDNELIKKDNELLKKNLELSETKITELETKIKQLKKMHVHDVIDFPIISVDILTGQKIEYDTITKINSRYKTGINTLRKHIDKHNHFRGVVLRSGTDKPYWKLPDNFKFSNLIKPTIQTQYVKRVDKNTGEQTYYNSIIEASFFVQQEIDKNAITGKTTDTELIRKTISELFRGNPTRKAFLNKFNWFKMKEIGFIVNIDGTTTNIDEVFVKTNKSDVEEKVEENDEDNETKVSSNETKVSSNDVEEDNEEDNEEITGNNEEEIIDTPNIAPNIINNFLNEKEEIQEVIPKEIDLTKAIIVRNLKTNTEKTYPEYTHAIFDKFMNKITLYNKFLNKHLNYKQFTFRTADQPYYWLPPKGLQINEKVDSARLKYFVKIVHTTLDNVNTYYYNAISDIAEHLFPKLNKQRIASAIKKRLNKKTDKTTNNNKEILELFKPYKFSRIQSCGQFIYKDRIEDINETIYVPTNDDDE